MLPRNKEVRYLQTTKYKKHSGTWYAENFKAVVGRPDAVTFDASPTTFRLGLGLGLTLTLTR